MRHSVCLIVAALALAACDVGAGVVERPAPPREPMAASAAPTLPPVEGFAHQAGAEVFGYYFPTTEVRIGDLKLSHLFIGDEAEFLAWEEANGQGPGNFAPVMFQFDDLTSETIANELGGQTPSVVVRVLPAGYGVSESVVRFAGEDPALGVVTLEGVFVQPTLARSRAAGGGDEPVLRGVLTIGDQIYEGQTFSWSGGG